MNSMERRLGTRITKESEDRQRDINDTKKWIEAMEEASLTEMKATNSRIDDIMAKIGNLEVGKHCQEALQARLRRQERGSRST